VREARPASLRNVGTARHKADAFRLMCLADCKLACWNGMIVGLRRAPFVVWCKSQRAGSTRSPRWSSARRCGPQKVDPGRKNRGVKLNEGGGDPISARRCKEDQRCEPRRRTIRRHDPVPFPRFSSARSVASPPTSYDSLRRCCATPQLATRICSAQAVGVGTSTGRSSRGGPTTDALTLIALSRLIDWRHSSLWSSRRRSFAGIARDSALFWRWKSRHRPTARASRRPAVDRGKKDGRRESHVGRRAGIGVGNCS